MRYEGRHNLCSKLRRIQTFGAVNLRHLRAPRSKRPGEIDKRQFLLRLGVPQNLMKNRRASIVTPPYVQLAPEEMHAATERSS